MSLVTNILQEEASFHEYQFRHFKGALPGSHPQQFFEFRLIIRFQVRLLGDDQMPSAEQPVGLVALFLQFFDAGSVAFTRATSPILDPLGLERLISNLIRLLNTDIRRG